MHRQQLPTLMKKLALLLMVVLVICVLPGCSVFSGLNTDPVTLRFVYMENSADYAPIAEAFHQKYPNITVELDPVTYSGRDPMSQFKTKAASADAVRLPSMSADNEVLDVLLPLDTYITTDQNFPQNDFFSGSLEGLRVDGKQVGLPAGLNPYVMYYDPAKFQTRGVSLPLADWTLEEFVSAAMALNNTDDALVGTQDYTFGFCSTPQFFDPVILTYVFGGGVFDSIYAPTNPTMNMQANIESLTWYASLRNEFGLIPPFDESRRVGELVVRSNCGFWMDWLDRSGFGQYIQNREIAALPLPVYNQPVSISTLDFYAVMSNSIYPDETWKWLRFLMDQPAASGNLIPPIQSHISDEEFATHARSDVLEVARNMPSEGIVLGLETIQDSRLGKVLELYVNTATQVMAGDVTAEMALDEAQRQAEQAFGQ